MGWLFRWEVTASVLDILGAPPASCSTWCRGLNRSKGLSCPLSSGCICPPRALAEAGGREGTETAFIPWLSLRWLSTCWTWFYLLVPTQAQVALAPDLVFYW